MRLAILCVGKPSRGWPADAVQDYARRLRRWDGLDEAWVKPERFRGDIDAVRSAEGERLRSRVAPRDRLICIDERGEGITTEAFSDLIQASRLDGVGQLWFAIGGAYGHADQTRRAAHRTLQLSSMVLNHEVARVVLIEQIYRAYALLNGVPYHH